MTLRSQGLRALLQYFQELSKREVVGRRLPTLVLLKIVVILAILVGMGAGGHLTHFFMSV